MTVVVTHTTPADGTFSATGAAAWNADHALSGIGTMAEQNANSVTITGGTISGTTISGLGTMSTQNANNVAITGGTISGVTLPAGGSTLQVQYNNAGAIAGMSGTSWDDTNRSLTVTGATVTTSNPVLNLSQTWNNAATTFTSYKLNVTDTASNASSLLADFQVGGSSKFTIDKTGKIVWPNVSGSGNTNYIDGATNQFSMYFYVRGSIRLTVDNTGALTTTGALQVGGTDAIITRKAAANLRFGAADAAAPVAQILSVQSVVAGTTNTAGANLTITGSQGTGTGAGGSIVFQVAPAGTTGTAQNALATALTINSDKSLSYAGPLTVNSAASGGSQTVLDFSAQSFPKFKTPNFSFYSSNSGGAYLYIAPGVLSLRTSDTSGITADLNVEAANTLAQRNGVNAQTFRLYNTYTDASNYERIGVTWASNIAYIQPQNAGTGSARLLVLSTGSTVVASLPAAATAGAGARAFVTDATLSMTLGIGITVAGGGANKVPVYSDGTNWLIG